MRMLFGFEQDGKVGLREKLSYSKISKAIYGDYEGDDGLAEQGNEFHRRLGDKLASGTASFDLKTLSQAEFLREVWLTGDLGKIFVLRGRADYVYVSMQKRIAHFIEGKMRGEKRDSDILQAACDAVVMMGDKTYGKGKFDLGLHFYYGNSDTLVPVDVKGIRKADSALIALGETALAFLKLTDKMGSDGGVPMIELRNELDESFASFMSMASGFFGVNTG